jgi:hypothetical protein
VLGEKKERRKDEDVSPSFEMIVRVGAAALVFSALGMGRAMAGQNDYRYRPADSPGWPGIENR